jgi:hypothetical protein
MGIPRNRTRPSTTFAECPLKFAEEARAAANLLAPSRERDRLLKQADKAETLACAADRLAEA